MLLIGDACNLTAVMFAGGDVRQFWMQRPFFRQDLLLLQDPPSQRLRIPDRLHFGAGRRFPLPPFALHLRRQQVDLPATGRATIGVGGGAGLALHQQHVAGVLLAVDDAVTCLAALEAGAHHIVGDPLGEAAVEDEVLALVAALESQGLYLPGVVDDATVQLADLLEAVVAEPGTGFLAADAAGAVEQHGLFLLVLQFFQHFLHGSAEGLGLGQTAPPRSGQ